MKFSALISCPPHSDDFHDALLTIHSTLKSNHLINQVFFLDEAVTITQYSIATNWESLSKQHNIPLALCSGAVAKWQLPPLSIDSNFIIAGLGEWVTKTLESDRLLHFNGSDSSPIDLIMHCPPPKGHNFLLIEAPTLNDANLTQLKDLALALTCFDQTTEIILNTRDPDAQTSVYEQTLSTLATFGIEPTWTASTCAYPVDYQGYRYVIQC